MTDGTKIEQADPITLVARKWAAELQDIYDRRTAGDHTWMGVLGMFLAEVRALPEPEGLHIGAELWEFDAEPPVGWTVMPIGDGRRWTRQDDPDLHHWMTKDDPDEDELWSSWVDLAADGGVIVVGLPAVTA